MILIVEYVNHVDAGNAKIKQTKTKTKYMAAKVSKSNTSSSSKFKVKPKVRRKGVVAKTKASKLKSSKNYLKKSRGQG